MATKKKTPAKHPRSSPRAASSSARPTTRTPPKMPARKRAKPKTTTTDPPPTAADWSTQWRNRLAFAAAVAWLVLSILAAVGLIRPLPSPILPGVQAPVDPALTTPGAARRGPLGP